MAAQAPTMACTTLEAPSSPTTVNTTPTKTGRRMRAKASRTNKHSNKHNSSRHSNSKHSNSKASRDRANKARVLVANKGNQARVSQVPASLPASQALDNQGGASQAPASPAPDNRGRTNRGLDSLAPDNRGRASRGPGDRARKVSKLVLLVDRAGALRLVLLVDRVPVLKDRANKINRARASLAPTAKASKGPKLVQVDRINKANRVLLLRGSLNRASKRGPPDKASKAHRMRLRMPKASRHSRMPLPSKVNNSPRMLDTPSRTRGAANSSKQHPTAMPIRRTVLLLKAISKARQTKTRKRTTTQQQPTWRL